MEFTIDYRTINQLKPGENGMIIFKPDQISIGNSQQSSKLSKVIDLLGNLSAKAQGLKTVITNWSKFGTSDHTLYLKLECNELIGYLKVGYKKLFFWDELNKIHELKPLCVLDFYVNEEYQRNGYGKILFEKLLENENILPEKIAYDRPSEKLIKFLKKYYNLKDYIPQNNNYVIFNEYFINRQPNKNNYQGYEDEEFNKNNTLSNTKYSNNKWNNDYDNKSQAKQRTLGANSSMVNLNTKNEMPFTKITNTKLKSDYSPIRTGTRNFSKLIPTNSTSKKEYLDRSNNKSGYKDNITPTKQRNLNYYENQNEIKNEIIYENLYPQSQKVEKINDYKQTYGFSNKNNNEDFNCNNTTSKINEQGSNSLDYNFQEFGNLNDKENKNFNAFNNRNSEFNDNFTNKKASNQNQKFSAKGVNTSKKNFSSLTLGHHDNPSNSNNNDNDYDKNMDQNYTDFKSKNNSKNEFTSSSNYGAYYKIRK